MDNYYFSVFRNEIKFFLSHEKFSALKKDFDKILYKDKNSTSEGYKVRSLYFDSINNIDYNTKLSGIENRKKIRLRTYCDSSNFSKLEVKLKKGNLQHKVSIMISNEDAIELIKCNYEVLYKYFDKYPCAKEIYTVMKLGCYHPVVMVEYDRIAYYYPLFDTRITFDYNLKSSESNFNLFDKNINFMLHDVSIVLEVKYNEILIDFIKSIIRKYCLTQITMSKYCNARKNYTEFNY